MFKETTGNMSCPMFKVPSWINFLSIEYELQNFYSTSFGRKVAHREIKK